MIVAMQFNTLNNLLTVVRNKNVVINGYGRRRLNDFTYKLEIYDYIDIQCIDNYYLLTTYLLTNLLTTGLAK